MEPDRRLTDDEVRKLAARAKEIISVVGYHLDGLNSDEIKAEDARFLKNLDPNGRGYITLDELWLALGFVLTTSHK